MARAPIPDEEWTDPRHRRGLAGERAVIAQLLTEGWRIEAHRFRVGRAELDLVVRRGSLVAFVEVKTRGSAAAGSPAEAVGWAKRRTLARVAEVWRLRFGRAGDCYRFDVASVRVREPGYEIEVIEDAWRLHL